MDLLHRSKIRSNCGIWFLQANLDARRLGAFSDALSAKNQNFWSKIAEIARKLVKDSNCSHKIPESS
jgi:hypothetical protein